MIIIDFIDPFAEQSYPQMVISSIDGDKLYIFPKIYRISDNKLAYIYKDNRLISKLIDDNITMNLVYKTSTLDIAKMS